MTKDQVRARVWGALESSGAAVGSPWSAIPNYKGADDAARILAGLPEFREAQVVKSNPDPAQGPFRLAALRAGKKLYTPVPELVQDTPFVLLDPEVLAHNGVAFEEVENASGFLQHGLRVEFRDIEPIDFFVVGCVAVTRAGGRVPRRRTASPGRPCPSRRRAEASIAPSRRCLRRPRGRRRRSHPAVWTRSGPSPRIPRRRALGRPNRASPYRQPPAR